jgi:hypothetical protein
MSAEDEKKLQVGRLPLDGVRGTTIEVDIRLRK